MAKNQVSTRHHYVPEFYLRRWADAGGQLVEYSKPYPGKFDRQRRYPRETGFENNLYTLENLPPDQVDIYEKGFFKTVDTLASNAMNKMDRGETRYTVEERSAWARFIMSLLFRNPENIASVKRKLLNEVFTVTKSDQREYAKNRPADAPRHLRDALSLDRSKPVVDLHALQLVADTSDSEGVGNHFIRMKWGSIRLPVGVPALLTSDRPLYWAYSLADPRCHLLIPTGPKTLFWAVNDEHVMMQIHMIKPSKLAALINEHITRRAVKRVWSISDGNLDFVKSYMGVNPPRTMEDALFEWVSGT